MLECVISPAEIARQIIRRRQGLGWTQADLAGRARVRPETLSRLETGKHAPNVAYRG
jgi:transcriptional regulator with XRE-family HTH domain